MLVCVPVWDFRFFFLHIWVLKLAQQAPLSQDPGTKSTTANKNAPNGSRVQAKLEKKKDVGGNVLPY